MLVDSLAFQIEKIGMPRCILGGKLDRGEDAALAVASSARPFMTAARFAHEPQPTLVVVAGGGSGGCFRAKRRCLRRGGSCAAFFPSVVINRLRPSIPMRAWSPSAWRPRIRLRAGEASSWSLLRDPLSVFLPPAEANAQAPLSFHEGDDLADGVMPGVEEFGDLARALEERGYANTGELDGPGTFAVHGGVIDVYPAISFIPSASIFFSGMRSMRSDASCLRRVRRSRR